MRRPDWYIKQLRERISIADYAGKRLAWDRRKSRPSAGDYWAPCPFHTEKSASFHVRDKEGIFKCFGCGEGGDIFKLCQKLEGVDFVGAIDLLAVEAGMPPPESTPGEQQAQDTRARLMRIVAKAHALYQRALLGPEGIAARAYLEKRGLGPDAWKQFGIGLAPDNWTWLIDALSKDGVRREDMFATGLAREGGRSGAIDLFRNRIMFPICDPQGRVIAFGGRALMTDDKTPKYVNSSDSEIYHKGRTLYRLKEAREILSKSKASGFVVAEGYLDVAAFERAGIAAVAPLGTALTEDQLMLAWKAGEAPILCFDGDSAGLRAAERALDVALPHLGPERTVRIALLPPGLDPDDVFRSSGPEALAALLENARPAGEALFEREKNRKPLDTPEARADLKKRIFEATARITHEETRRQYQRMLGDKAFELFRPAPRPPWVKGAGGGKGTRGPRPEAPAQPTDELKRLTGLQRSTLLENMVRMAVDNPFVLRAGADLFAQVVLEGADLDHIRHAVLDLWAASKTVDREALSHHLQRAGLDSASRRVLHWPVPMARKPGVGRGGEGPAAKARAVDLQPDLQPAPQGTAQDGIGIMDRSARVAPSERERHDIEAEWMAFLALEVAAPQVREELEEARRHDLDTDDDAFKAAMDAAKAGRSIYGAALTRGRDDTDADAGPAPEDRAA